MYSKKLSVSKPLQSRLSQSQLNPLQSSSFHNLEVIEKIAHAKTVILLAQSPSDGQQYVIKVYPYEEKKCHRRFINETRFLDLQHPNIITFYHHEKSKSTIDYLEYPEFSSIVMEYAPHGDFLQLYDQLQLPQNHKLARTFFRQMINGIEYLHLKGIAHMDIKPSNLMLDSEFRLKIIDFDLSFIKGDRVYEGQSTADFRAPEVRTMKCKNPYAADVFSMGVILFNFCMGYLPYVEDQQIESFHFDDIVQRGDIHKFWKAHLELNDNNLIIDPEFKELFESMITPEPMQRATLTDIKLSRWYNGPTYSQSEIKNIVSPRLKELLVY